MEHISIIEIIDRDSLKVGNYDKNDIWVNRDKIDISSDNTIAKIIRKIQCGKEVKNE